MNCENITLSSKLSEQRMALAKVLLGDKVLRKLIAYSLFLLGATRSAISSFLNMPGGSVRSLILAVNKQGLPALEDQRCRTSSFRPQAPLLIRPKLEKDENRISVNLGIGNLLIDIQDCNTLQKKVVLLTFLQNGLLERNEVAQALNLSEDRTAKLATALKNKDVEAIVDQRQGQQKDYLFSAEVKAELIQQFVLDVVTHGKTSGELLAQNLNDRCNLVLSSRSILHHIAAMGLNRIKKSLPEYLEELKKKSSTSSTGRHTPKS
ncbi:MAG: hypothetical protein JRI47_07450 [Deltaproteobacteria bacterium]|nr:hypothetical protein [Deltaproteobacteria bacterium]